jgi:hypothetical protein
MKNAFLRGTILMFKEHFMKNTIKLIGIIALVAATGFSIIACDNGGSGGGVNDSGEQSASPNHTLSGSTVNQTNLPVTYSDGVPTSVTDFGYGLDFNAYYIAVDNGEEPNPLDLIRPLSYFLYGSPEVKINSGKLTIKLGTPKPEAMFEYGNWVSLNPSDAKIWAGGPEEISFLTEDGNYGLALMNPNGWSATIAYASKDVTVVGQEYSFALKQGWNYIIWKPESNEYVVTRTPDSSYKWTVFGPFDD